MRNIHRITILTTLFLCCLPLQAADDWAGLAGILSGAYRAHTPHGTTPYTASFLPELGIQYAINKIQRIRVTSRYINDRFKADQGGLTADMKGYQLLLQWQHNARLNRWFQPWWGGGLIANWLTFSRQRRVDKAGFVIKRYANSDDITLAAQAIIGLEKALGSRWSAGVMLDYQYPFTDGPEGLSVGVQFVRSF